MKLLVSLLNWRTADLTVRALDAVVPELRALGDSKVCVVDNDSQDGSLEKLQDAVKAKGYGDVAEVVSSGRNGGFGFGNNVALRRGLDADDKPAYFFLLNSDAFVDEGALRALYDYMEAHPRVGFAGSLIHGLDGELQESCFRFPTPWSEVERNARFGVVTALLRDRMTSLGVPATTTTDVDWVAGAAVMIRREALEQVGIFDETYFLYYEETDLCLRAKRAGWEVAWVRESSVAHIAGASTGVTSHKVVQKPMPKYVFESRRHYFLKNHGRVALWGANLAHLVAGASFRARRRLQGKSDPERPREWLDQVLFNLKHP